MNGTIDDFCRYTPYLSENLSRRWKILMAHLELGQHKPDLGKRERFVRDDVQARAIHLAEHTKLNNARKYKQMQRARTGTKAEGRSTIGSTSSGS